MEKNFVNTLYKLIIIGGSSGSLEALKIIFNSLDASFNIPIVIVVHRNNLPSQSLNQVLASKTLLKIKEVDEKDILLPFHVYLAPPDYHLLFERDGSLSLDYSEKVKFSRPSIDVSFQSASLVFKNKLLAILLSGANADGSEGMEAIKNFGGLTIIQNPEEALFSMMPMQAKALIPIDHILNAKEIAQFLNNLMSC